VAVGPEFNGQAPRSCYPLVEVPGPDVYQCQYPDNSFAVYASETDWTLLDFTDSDGWQFTPDGDAYFNPPGADYRSPAAAGGAQSGPCSGAPHACPPQDVPIAQSTAATAAQSAALALKNFPGAVLLLPVDQSPYASWPFQGVQVYPDVSYLEYAGDPVQQIGTNVLSIKASLGPFDNDPRTDLVCQPTTSYCYFPPRGQSRGAEIFNGLKARGNDAFVLHKTFPSEQWSLWWFDQTSNTSYTLTFGGQDVITMFEPLGTFNKSSATAAQKLAAMADNLVPWTAGGSQQ
jgi:hypothetical protein